MVVYRVHIHYYYGIGSQEPNGDGLLGPNSIMVVYMDPLGKRYVNPKLLNPKPTPFARGPKTSSFLSSPGHDRFFFRVYKNSLQKIGYGSGRVRGPSS